MYVTGETDMTTIAFRDGVMASDSMASNEGYLQKTNCKKIYELECYRTKEPCVVGLAQGFYAGLVFLEWFVGNTGDDVMDNTLDTEDDFEALVAYPDGGLYTFNRYLIAYDIDADFHAIGSGAKCAMAAMYCGRSAVEAVEVASEIDMYTGGAVQWAPVQKH